MLYLYLGYIASQSIAVIEKISVSDLSMSALFFSIIVFVIWSLFPVSGYLVAKIFKAQGQLSGVMLLAFGIALGLIERGLYYAGLLTYGDEYISLAIAFCLSVVIGFISINSRKDKLA